MAIQPIDVRTIMPKTQEVSQVQQNHNQRTLVEQTGFQKQMDKEVKENSEKVIDPHNSNNTEGHFDAKEEGKNKYYKEGKKKKKEELADPNTATIDNKGHFDFKI